MNDDYSYLVENGECGRVLVVLALCSEKMLDIGDLQQQLPQDVGTIEASVNFLLAHSFINGSFVPREGHPRQRRRMYYITPLGVEAVTQLIA